MSWVGNHDATGAMRMNSAGGASTLCVSVTAGLNTSLTATLPAPPPGQFHYINHISITKLYGLTGVASGSGVAITTTNLNGLAFLGEQIAAAVGSVVVIQPFLANPIKSQTAGTATTIVCPAQVQTSWRITVLYYIGA